MARTGSGKSAAFIIPMLENLKIHSSSGARALIISPSRELAMQTMKFTKDLGKLSDLRCACIVGGDGLDDQFSQMASSPDIIIGTPGRLLHLLVEMDADLKNIEYLVFDEADRLFEMGFRDTLMEIMHKLSPNRQTILFSATLPKSLVEFAQAGLKDPVLVRLDADTKISPDLKLCFFPIREKDKDAALIYLLKKVIPDNHQTIIFAATKHHVEFLHELLLKLNIENSYIYGSLDQTARMINLSKFRNGITKFLIVTDVAARGLDIPLLNNVIHYDFPDKSKLFLHRSGRAARAGKVGTAYALLSLCDMPYLLDLQLFLGRRLVVAGDVNAGKVAVDYTKDVLVGGFPSSLYLQDYEILTELVKNDTNLLGAKKVAENGMKQYLRTRSAASKESISRAKDFISTSPIGSTSLGVHPVFTEFGDTETLLKEAAILTGLRNFRPQETIFEIKKLGIKQSPHAEMMTKRRSILDGIIQKAKQNSKMQDPVDEDEASPEDTVSSLVQADDSMIQSVFKNAITSAKKRKGRAEGEAISYLPADFEAEKQYSVTTGFATEAKSVEMDLIGDEKHSKRGSLEWDKKKKRFRRDTIGADNRKKIKTDSGRYIDASYKTDAFEKWKKKHKGENFAEKDLASTSLSSKGSGYNHKFKHNKTFERKPLDPKSVGYERKVKQLKKKAQESGQPLNSLVKQNKKVKSELKSADKIRKERKIKQKRLEKNARPSKKNKK
jgi:ATP-dependent RNA helicase DDX54/DBP10